MSQKVEVRRDKEVCETFPIGSLAVGEVGILTQCGPYSQSRIGDPVVGGNGEVCFPRAQTFSRKESAEGFSFRRLLPGEQVIITGE